ncbi:hypothetical protein MKQ70_15650 [Chitinophaga sedimenti]|uniref:hypothetical protein n=1 Tax=Chitinophaga sedimenti TaxID=2033606 RepID=UPI0020044F2E|nr:hypothetical protein [Chitinophaga sedimenti]MCK7556371.1 hypothetical protein [Chitinophaga sedimenti]
MLLSLNDQNSAQEYAKSSISVKKGENLIILDSSHLLGQNDVIFEEKHSERVLLLSEILPNPDSRATQIISELARVIAELIGNERDIVGNLLGLGAPPDKQFIYQQLLEEYTSTPLLNGQQLAFLLLYANVNDTVNPALFSVKTKDGIRQLQNVVLYAPDTPSRYLPLPAILADNYAAATSILALTGGPFKATGEVTISFKPYLDKRRFLIPCVSGLKDEADSIALMEELYALWEEDPEMFSFLEMEEGKSWTNFLHFNPALAIYGSDLALEDERLPEFVIHWLQDEVEEGRRRKRVDFLRIFGVSLSGSDIVRIRKYLLNLEQTLPVLNNLHVGVVKNTLLFLHKEQVLFMFNSDRANLLRDLYGRLPDNVVYNKDIPVPIISSQRICSIELAFVEAAPGIDLVLCSSLLELQYPIHQLPGSLKSPIVFRDLLRKTDALNQLFPLVNIQFDVLNEAVLAAAGIELSTAYYADWKALFPDFRIVGYPGGVPYTLQFEGGSIFDYVKDNIIFFENKIVVNNELNDRNMISRIEAEINLPANAINRLKELFNKYDESIQDFLKRLQSNKTLRDEFERLKEKEKIEQKKKELADGISTNRAYSMKWFMALLELMVMSGSTNPLDNAAGNIVFSRIEYNPSDLRLITLCGPSSSISPNIDLFTDFVAIFSYRDESGEKGKNM